MSATLENKPLDQNTQAFLHEAHDAKFDFHTGQRESRRR